MPPGAKHGERRTQAKRRSPTKIGYLGKDVAEVVQRSRPYISKLIKQGHLETHPDGSIVRESAHKYFREEFIMAGILHPTVQPEGFYRDAEAPMIQVNNQGEPRKQVYNFDEERSRLLHLQADRIELELAREKGELVPWPEIEYSISVTYTELIQTILTFADRLTPLLVGIEDERDMHEIVQDVAESTISSLASSLQTLVDKHNGNTSGLRGQFNFPT